MTATTLEPSIDLDATDDSKPHDHEVPVTRRRIDIVLVSIGAVAAVVMLAAGALLWWGASFSQNYVSKELSAQNITFGSKESLEQEGRGDLAEFADQKVTTGAQAEAYADYIAGHVAKTSGGKTYSELGGPERAAKQAVTDAKASGAPADEIAKLQDTATQLTGQRDTVFKGEMLRGTLLSTYAWSTIGRIAGIASIVSFIGAAAMMVFVILGVVHLRRMKA